MKHIKIVAIGCVLVFFSGYAQPVHASTLGELQTSLISLLRQLISLLLHEPVNPVSPVVVLDRATSTAPYDISDVVSVVTENIDPIPNAADDEYVQYVITLKDSSKRLVKANGFMPVEMQRQNFYQSGYSGDVEKLRALATALTSPKSTFPVIHSLKDMGENKVQLNFGIDLPGGTPSVMGPVLYGSIDWGDGHVAESLFILASERYQIVTKSHEYSVGGEYKVRIIDRANASTEQSVVVK